MKDIEEIDRRDILKATGAAGAAGLVGIGAYTINQGSPADDPPGVDDDPDDHDGPPEDDPPGEDSPEDGEIPHAGEFDTIVEAVDLGADPDGEDSATFLFEEHVEDETLLAFEPGTYRIGPVEVSSQTHLGLVNTGNDPVRFVPTDGDCQGGHPYLFFDGVSDLLLENITLDFNNTDSGGPVHLFLEGHSTIRNVTCEGACANQIAVMRVEVRDSAGSALIDSLEAKNIDENQTLTGVYVSDHHAGELTFQNCNLESFSDNGLYASAPGGPEGEDGEVNVIGGTYRNNNIANVRLGSTGSKAEDVTVVVNSETPGYGQLNARGIRLRNRSGQTIENCDITFEEGAADSFGGVVFHGRNSGGLVKDTTIRIQRDDVPAIRAFPDENPGNGRPEFENVVITGTASGNVTATFEGRDETEFRNCTIVQTGDDRDGIAWSDCADCRIVDSHIHVTGTPIDLHDSSVTIEDTTIITPNGREEIDERTLENESLTIE